MNHHRPFLILPSTRSFLREGLRTPGYRLFDFLHGYIYARWPYLYISIGVGEHPLSPRLKQFSRLFTRLFPPRRSSRGEGSKPGNVAFADTYHGKVVHLAAATQLVTVHEEIRLPNLEKIVPYDRACDIILKNPDHIVALDCPCRSARPNPCKPLDVCLIVGEPFASFVSEHQPERTRWITSEEAVEILRAEDERGHVHHAFFKDAMLGRFYAICNCCACCCGAMQAHQRGTPMLASSGYISSMDEDLCIGCSDCVDFCQFFALSVSDGHAAIDQALCMGCGVCVNHCEHEALSLILRPERGEPLEIQKLIEQFQQAAAA
jgi:Pyruvate/2-oxoacid:ferredoxin oxidoreductase delta subunit